MIRVQLLHPDAKMPTQGHAGDAGFDLYVSEARDLKPRELIDVPCGIAIEPDPHMWVRIVGRSSTWRRLGLLVVEGVIDYGYRGEIYTGVVNMSDDLVPIRVGDRIAQMIPQLLPMDNSVLQVEMLTEHARGSDGFGSTGR